MTESSDLHKATELPEHLGMLYNDQAPKLVRLAAVICQNAEDAQDIVQDAFLGLQRRWDRLDRPEAAAAYLRVSVVNGARSMLRRRFLVRRRLAENNVAPGPETQLLAREEYLELIRIVQKLPRRQFQCLTLRYWGELSDNEIARQLGISEVAVRSTISRAIDRLSKALPKG